MPKNKWHLFYTRMYYEGNPRAEIIHNEFNSELDLLKYAAENRVGLHLGENYMITDKSRAEQIPYDIYGRINHLERELIAGEQKSDKQLRAERLEKAKKEWKRREKRKEKKTREALENVSGVSSVARGT